jgi:hypothetical protein
MANLGIAQFLWAERESTPWRFIDTDSSNLHFAVKKTVLLNPFHS